MIKFISAGESHGKCFTGIISGLPSGVKINIPFILNELELRRCSSGRSSRQNTEKDRFEITSGLYSGETTGAPLSFTVRNEDVRTDDELKDDNVPRPGHADYTGAIKYDIPLIVAAERASARSTVISVAAGAILRTLLSDLGIICSAHVVQIGNVKAYPKIEDKLLYNSVVDACPTRCADISYAPKLEREIERVRELGDSIGGKIEVDICGLPVGIGSYATPFDRFDVALAGALMSIPAVKAVEFGLGVGFADSVGSQCVDGFTTENGKIVRQSNNCGGVEGGITNGNTVTAFITVKPVPTIKIPIDSVNLKTLERAEPTYRRSDVCAVPTAAVIARNVAAIIVAERLSREFGGSTLETLKSRIKASL